MKRTILFLFCIFLLPLAYALELDDTLIESVGLNTSIQVNETIYFDLLDVDINGNYIYFENYTYTLGSEYIISTINITESDQRYYYNSTNKDLPYIVSSSSRTKVIYSGNISSLMNISSIFSIPCLANTSQIYGYFKSASCDNCNIEESCNGDNTMSFNISNMPLASSSTITVTYYTESNEQHNTTCNSFFSVIINIIKSLGIMFSLGLVLLFSLVFKNLIQSKKDNIMPLFNYLLIFIISFMILMIAIAVLSLIMGIICTSLGGLV